MVLVPPGDIQRAVLTRAADRWFHFLVASTLVLFVGAFMEYVKPLDRLHTHNVNTRTRGRTPRQWVIRCQTTWHVLAIVLVVGSIGFEGIFEYLTARAEDKVRDFDNITAIRAGAAAKSAEDSAGLAQNKADAVAKKADGLDGRIGESDKRLGEVSNRAKQIVSQLNVIDETILLQGPRWRLLDARRDEFIKTLSPFGGQKAMIGTCLSESGRLEEYTLELELIELLKDGPEGRPGTGARWYIRDTTAPCLFRRPGLSVIISREAPPREQEAAQSLRAELAKLHLMSMMLVDSPADIALLKASVAVESPEVRAWKVPEGIFVIVGTNPLVDLSTFGKQTVVQKKTTKTPTIPNSPK